MSLPFKTLSEPETVEIAGCIIPKHGCLTVAEERAIRDFGAEMDSSEDYKKLTPAQADLWLKERVVTILIKSRLDNDWTHERTIAPKWEIKIGELTKSIEPTMDLLEELFNFFMNEQRRWKEIDLETLPDEGEDTPKKKGLTGKKSTGNLDSPTPEKNGSKPKALAAAQ